MGVASDLPSLQMCACLKYSFLMNRVFVFFNTKSFMNKDFRVCSSVLIDTKRRVSDMTWKHIFCTVSSFSNLSYINRSLKPVSHMRVSVLYRDMI